MKTTTTTPRNFLYARFSSAEQAAGASENDQIKQASNWCDNRGETLSTPYFIDRGVSAKEGKNRDEGTEFHKMLQLVKPGDRVLIRDNDRFGRDNVLKALGHLQSIVEKMEISFVVLSTGVEINR
jgi:DNA invertase Pin-like site-specific DNA recombinase